MAELPVCWCAATDVLTRLLKTLVDHFIQPIHLVSLDGALRDGNDDKNDSSTKFVTAIQHQILRTTISPRSAALVLISHYKAHVRETLYAPRPVLSQEKRFSKYGVPVLLHYQQLLTCLVLNNHLDESAEEEHERDLLNHAALCDSLLCLSNDITAIQNTNAMVQEDTQPNDGDEVNSNVRMQSIILQALLRLLEDLLRGMLKLKSSNSIPIDTARRCFISLLPFYAPPTYDAMERTLQTTLFDLPSYTNFPLQPESTTLDRPVDIWHSIGLHHSELTSNADPVVQNLAIEALLLLDKIFIADSPSSSPTKPSFLIQVVPNNDVASPCHVKAYRQLIPVLGGSDAMAQSVRVHFFGRDILADDQIVLETRQRLHLGKTISETPEKVFKHYKSNDSRILAALTFISLTASVSLSCFEDLVPILYELINSASADAVRWGSTALFHLIEVSPEIWCEHPIVCDNLLQMLHSEIQSQRDGPTLVFLGLAQARLLRAILANERSNEVQEKKWINIRRKASQQWLMILHQNNFCFTKNYLIWGVLYGGILPSMSEHARSPTLDGLEIGRLGLQALLPVLQQGLESGEWNGNDEDDTPVVSSKDRQYLMLAIHRGALIAVSNVFLAAHPIIQRHQGKILCTLVAYMRKCCDNANRDLATSVAAMAYKMGESNRVARDAVVRKIIKDHDAGVQEVMAAIQHRSYQLAITGEDRQAIR